MYTYEQIDNNRITAPPAVMNCNIMLPIYTIYFTGTIFPELPSQIYRPVPLEKKPHKRLGDSQALRQVPCLGDAVAGSPLSPLNHIIIRGLNRQNIFLDDCDRNDFWST